MIEIVLFMTGDASACPLPGGRSRTGRPVGPVRRTGPAPGMGHRACGTDTRATLAGPGLSTAEPERHRGIQPGPVKSRFGKAPDSVPIVCMRIERSWQSGTGRTLLPGTLAEWRRKADCGLWQSP